MKSALAQTYSPLEIILTDDASQDKTLEIMADLAGSYRGPHTVQVRQNARRVGLVGGLNEVARISRGELLAMAAGDDISLPHRVTDTVKAWVGGNRTDFSLHSAMFTMDENSRVKGQKLEPPRHTWNLGRWEDRPMAVESGSQKGEQIVGLVRQA